MKSLSRRELLAVFPAALVACQRAEALPASCDDTTLSAEAQKTRATLGYVEASPYADKSCSACEKFVAPKASGQCGSCKLLDGPIHPRGWCKAFAPKS